MIGIYKIVSPSNSIYIGQSWNIERRLKKYRHSLGKGQTILYNSFQKYGIDNHIFTIELELSNNILQSELDDHEIFLWNKYKNLGFTMMNIREPGNGGKMSEESKLKISLSKKGKVYPNMYNSKSEETRSKISKANTGKVRSKEHCKSISLRNLGKVTHSRIIEQYDLRNNFIREFNSICEAERTLNKIGANSNIIACCKGKLKHAYNFIWNYKN